MRLAPSKVDIDLLLYVRDEWLSAVGYQLSAKRSFLLLADSQQPNADSPKW
jgi:hypothetical protein